jgi:quercetin dioxygenase-like cupin family protein
MKAVDWNQVEVVRMNEKITRQLISGKQAMLARFFLAKGAVIPEHQHESEQFCQVVSGALKFIFRDGETVVRGGEVLPIPSGVPHAAEALMDTVAVDVFAPIRKDWLAGEDGYLRGER